jgi:hypothetical protein
LISEGNETTGLEITWLCANTKFANEKKAVTNVHR